MNIRGIDLGLTLNALKDFSMPLTPALRGYAVGNHDYLRKIHNSFSRQAQYPSLIIHGDTTNMNVRKMDMLNADLFLSNDVASKNFKVKLPGKTGDNVNHEQAGLHFISLVPIDGKLWKLDGLERQPMNLGEADLSLTSHASNPLTGEFVGDDWMGLARSIIEKRMQKYEGDQFQFSLLALCQSPLLAVRNDLSENIRTISAIEERLSNFQPDWRSFVDRQYFEKTLTGPNTSYGVTPQYLKSVSAPAPILREIQASTITTDRLLDLWKQHVDSQTQMRASYVEEEASIQQDEERAATRYHDYTPMVNTWLAALADKRVLKDLTRDASHGHDHG
jgi:ubiquitin carboxyl-terminal hydrolase L5